MVVFDVAPMHPVQEGVRRLMRNDVMRQAGKDHACRPGKVPKQKRLLSGTVVGVGRSDRMGIDS